MSLASLLADSGHEPMLASDFASARAVLNERPDLLVTDVKLAEYNGLHLAIRAASIGTAAIVVGEPDPVLQADAEREQATYVTLPLHVGRVLEVIKKVLDTSRRTRQLPRNQIRGIEALVDDSRVLVVDVSDEGMRIQMPAAHAPPLSFLVTLPQFNFTCRVERVWTRQIARTQTGVAVWCGAAISSEDSAAATAWRALVAAFAAPNQVAH